VTIAEPIRAAYIHVPYCHTICGYCDFYSQVLDRGGVGPLVDALLTELEAAGCQIPLAFETVFVGGGTPTTLPADPLRRLLAALAERADLQAELEFTVEANPATVTAPIAACLAGAGVTRVSIGAQSFDAGELRVLERIHQPVQVAQTVRTARSAGIGQVSLDLIFGIPGQTLDAWRRNLDAALALAPDHLSCYALMYEPGTPLYDQLHSGLVRRADPDLEADMYLLAIDHLAAAGFRHYEISNFARPGCECRHNLVYWRNECYLGVGPSACGFIDGVRYKNVADTAEYVRAVQSGRSPRVEEERLTPSRRAHETAMLELRLTDGIDARAFARRHSVEPRELFASAIQRHASLGLIESDERGVRLTRRGLLVADSVIADFL
jgi:oxygen-independent coproporphyrinogen-3 oxidase